MTKKKSFYPKIYTNHNKAITDILDKLGTLDLSQVLFFSLSKENLETLEAEDNNKSFYLLNISNSDFLNISNKDIEIS